MNVENSYQWRRDIVRGLLLVGLGAAILLDRMDVVAINAWWHYAPLLLVLIGINRSIGYPSAGDFIRGLWTAFTGIWLFAVFEGLGGLTLENSWPAFVIVAGAMMALRPFAERRFKSNQESGHEAR